MSYAETVDLEATSETFFDNADGLPSTQIEWVAHDLEPYVFEGIYPENVPSTSPFVDVKCRPAYGDKVNLKRRLDNRQYNGYVPIWIKARILRNHLRSRERCRRVKEQGKGLAEIIHSRGGYAGVGQRQVEECQLLATALGGDYIDWNLFPQDRSQGECGLWRIWQGLIAMVVSYLRRNGLRVELQVRLLYQDFDRPDHPTCMRYSVRFIRGSEENDLTVQSVRILLKSSVVASELAAMKEREEYYKIIYKILENQVNADLVLWCRKLQVQWTIVVEALLSDRASYPSAKTNSALSPWDFIPFVSTYRTFRESAEDFKNDNNAAAAIKLTLGILSAISDVSLINNVSSIVAKNALKVASNAVVQEATTAGFKKVVAKETGKIVGKGVLKTATIALEKMSYVGAMDGAAAKDPDIAADSDVIIRRTANQLKFSQHSIKVSNQKRIKRRNTCGL